MTDDPLDRLAAEEDWSRRARSVEDELARQRRKSRMRGRGFGRPRASAISVIFVGFVVTTLGSGLLLWAEVTPPGVTTFVFVLSAWLITLCLHEFSHALMAHRRGDHTVTEKGYLTLDIRRYGHPLLTFVLPVLFLIIGGLPLPSSAVVVRAASSCALSRAVVLAAGPAIDVIAAAILLVIVSVFRARLHLPSLRTEGRVLGGDDLLAYLQVVTAILNLIPVPGIDGYGIIEPFLPLSTQRSAEKIKPYGLILLFLLLLLPPVREAFYWSPT